MRDEMLFLGSGDSRSTELGNACAVLLRDGEPCLGIDYGYTAPRAWAEAFLRDSSPPTVMLPPQYLLDPKPHCERA